MLDIRYIMKKLIAILIITVSNAMVLHSQERTFLLKNGGIDNITVGMSVDELYSIVGKSNTEIVDLYLEGLFSPAIEVETPNIICELDCGNIWRIRVQDRGARTIEGIGIGSTMKELKNVYTDIKILKGEGDIFAYVDEIKTSFALDTIEINNPDLEAIPETAKVKWVLLLKD